MAIANFTRDYTVITRHRLGGDYQSAAHNAIRVMPNQDADITTPNPGQPRSSAMELTASTSHQADALRLLSCQRMGEADQAAIDLGISGLELMEAAGRAIADVAGEMTPAFAKIAVLCGPGNNGGDGFVAARHLAMRARTVQLGLLGPRTALTGDAAAMAQRYVTELHDGAISPISDELLDGVDLVIDALFGAGLSRPIDPDGHLAGLFGEIAARAIPVLAVDVPSGLDGDSGQAHGAVLPATRTVTFFRRKPGHLLLPGRNLCGAVSCSAIGIPDAVLHQPLSPSDEPAHVWANAPALWAGALPALCLDAHKYRRGHTVVVSGEIEMSGAARLAASAALRIGSGLVTVAASDQALLAHASQLSAILLSRGQSADDLRALLADRRMNAVVIGPGLGVDGALERVLAVLAAGAAAVLDADALTGAAAAPSQVFDAITALASRPVVFTPHEGEFARLFSDLTGNKLDRARQAAARSGAIVVLKGPDTVVAAPDGRTAINENAPPWLATAGSGDVLAGMIGGLLGGAMPAFEAACAAVWMHGASADAFGRGLIAPDIVDGLPNILRTHGCALTTVSQTP